MLDVIKSFEIEYSKSNINEKDLIKNLINTLKKKSKNIKLDKNKLEIDLSKMTSLNPDQILKISSLVTSLIQITEKRKSSMIIKGYDEFIKENYKVEEKAMYKKGDKAIFTIEKKEMTGEVMEYMKEQDMYKMKCENKMYEVKAKDMKMMKESTEDEFMIDEATMRGIVFANRMKQMLLEMENQMAYMRDKEGKELGPKYIDDFREICNNAVEETEELVSEMTMMRDQN